MTNPKVRIAKDQLLTEQEARDFAEEWREVQRQCMHPLVKMDTAAISSYPIATARHEPADTLLLFDQDWYIGWWHMKLGWVTQGKDGWKPIQPTHWRPLPPKPEDVQ